MSQILTDIVELTLEMLAQYCTGIRVKCNMLHFRVFAEAVHAGKSVLKDSACIILTQQLRDGCSLQDCRPSHARHELNHECLQDADLSHIMIASQTQSLAQMQQEHTP